MSEEYRKEAITKTITPLTTTLEITNNSNYNDNNNNNILIFEEKKSKIYHNRRTGIGAPPRSDRH